MSPTNVEELESQSSVCPDLQPCKFGEEERARLKLLVKGETYVAFPKWALGLLIIVLGGLWASSGALWFELQKKADKIDVELSREVIKSEIAELKVRLTKLETSIPSEYPPVWFMSQFKDLKGMVDKNNELLIEVRALFKAHTEKDALKGS